MLINTLLLIYIYLRILLFISCLSLCHIHTTYLFRCTESLWFLTPTCFRVPSFLLETSSTHMCGSHVGNPFRLAWHSSTSSWGCPSLLLQRFPAPRHWLEAGTLYPRISKGLFSLVEDISSLCFLSRLDRSFLFSIDWFVVQFRVGYFFPFGFDSMLFGRPGFGFVPVFGSLSGFSSKLTFNRSDSLSGSGRLLFLSSRYSTSN